MDNQEIEIELYEEPQEIEVENSDVVVRLEENVIESISVNGVEQEVDENKNVDISVPTKLSDLDNDNNTVQDANYVHTDNDYTDAEKSKLANLENYDDTEVKGDIADIKEDITDLDTNKADKTELPTTLAELTDDSTHRLVTDTEKTTWNNKSDFSGNYNDLSNKPIIPTKTSDLTNDSDFISDSSYVHTDNNYTNVEKNKLANLENYDDTEIKADIQALDNNKVDKVQGKGLSTNDFTDTEKTKLQGLSNYDDTEVKADISSLQSNKADKSDTYTKSQVNNLLDSKADTTDIPDVSNFITKNVNDLTYYYTKTEVDGKVSAVYKYKGTVATYQDLPSTDLTIGDVYNVETDGSNYAWTGTLWDKLGGNIDLSGYQEKIDSSHKLSADLVDDTSSTNKFVTASDKITWNNKSDFSGDYNDLSNKPNIPTVPTNISAFTNDAGYLTQHQDISGKEDKSNKVTSISSSSTDTQYPSAKCVYDNFMAFQYLLPRRKVTSLTSWENNGTGKKCTITDSDINSYCMVLVSIDYSSYEDAINAGISEAIYVFDGGFTVYADSVPSNTVSISYTIIR